MKTYSVDIISINYKQNKYFNSQIEIAGRYM